MSWNMGEIHFLDVGCADTTIIKSGKATILIDCSYLICTYENLLPKNHQIDAVFITHHHNDHFQGLGYLLQNKYTINSIFYSPYVWHEGEQSFRKSEWDDITSYLNAYERKGTNLKAVYRQSDFSRPSFEIEDMKFYIIEPKKELMVERQRHIHDGCLVIFSKLGNLKCLFTGDASDVSLSHIMNHDHSFSCKDVDILHASHHGSINGAEERFIRKCNPAYTIISTGIYNQNINIPHPTAIARYKRYTRQKVFRTDTNGSISATWNPNLVFQGEYLSE